MRYFIRSCFLKNWIFPNLLLFVDDYLINNEFLYQNDFTNKKINIIMNKYVEKQQSLSE